MTERTRSKPGQRRTFTRERPPEANDVGTLWRLFVAVPLSSEVMERVGAIGTRLAEKNWPIRWTDPGNAHLTLHFLGEVDAARAEMIRLALPNETARHQAFTLHTDGLGVFPDRARPRVLWMGLNGETERLVSLQAGVGRVLSQLDFAIEDRPFAPHITLGRAREQIGKERGMTIWTTLRGFQLGAPLDVPVSEVNLYRSHLDHTGARYELLASGKLTR
jgi:2'-5' RNA ligase